MKARTMSFAIKEQFDVGLDKLESEGIIEQVESSPLASPTVAVWKPSGSVRICADNSKRIIANSDLEQYPLPTIEEIRTKLSEGQKFSALDLSQAYHQLELEENSRVYTTINTHRGLDHYKRLPFGIHSAVSIFQRTIGKFTGRYQRLCGLRWWQHHYGKEWRRTYEMPGESFTEVAGLWHAFESWEITTDATKHITSLGHVFTANGVSPSPDKIRAMVEANPPTSVSEHSRLTTFRNKPRDVAFPSWNQLVSETLEELSTTGLVYFNWHSSFLNIFECLFCSIDFVVSADTSQTFVRTRFYMMKNAPYAWENFHACPFTRFQKPQQLGLERRVLVVFSETNSEWLPSACARPQLCPCNEKRKGGKEEEWWKSEEKDPCLDSENSIRLGPDKPSNSENTSKTRRSSSCR